MYDLKKTVAFPAEDQIDLITDKIDVESTPLVLHPHGFGFYREIDLSIVDTGYAVFEIPNRYSYMLFGYRLFYPILAQATTARIQIDIVNVENYRKQYETPICAEIITTPDRHQPIRYRLKHHYLFLPGAKIMYTVSPIPGTGEKPNYVQILTNGMLYPKDYYNEDSMRD